MLGLTNKREARQEQQLLATVQAKTLFAYYSNFELFWNGSGVTGCFISSIDLTKEDKKLEKLTARGFAGLVYQKWRYNIHYGGKDQFTGRFTAEIGSKFQELKRTENLYHKLFPSIKLKIEKLITLRSSDKTTGNTIKNRFEDKSIDRKVNKEAKKLGSEVVRSKEKPYRAIDMIGGEYGVQEKEAINDLKQRRGNWTSAEVEVQSGLRKRSKEDPDRWEWEPNFDRGEDKLEERDKNRDKGTQRDKTTRLSTREEQPSFLTQVSKIIDQVMALETPIAEYVDSFAHFFYINAMCPGKLEWNPATASTELKPAQATLEIEEIEETEKEKKIKKQKDQFAKLTLDEYQSLREKGEAVEDSLTLENLARRRNVVNKSGGKAKENRLKGMNGLCLSFSEEVVWSDLKNYDKVMKGITGFTEFKEELRKKTKGAFYYRSIGKKIPQTFYCLVGKAGVGKTEISKTLAKAYKRPIVMIGMAGQNHPKILKGMRPTLDSATYGRVAAALCEETFAVFRTKTEWGAKLKHLESKKKKTNYQKERIEYIKDEIKAITGQEKDKERLTKALNSINQYGDKKGRIMHLNLSERIKRLSGKFYALPSQAPIILLDEFEKVKEETVMFVVGQMTDREINFNYWDEFLEWEIDLSQTIIMLTANYWDRVPDFVRSRCKRVNIQLLTFKQRLEILKNRRDAFVREYFPSTVVGKQTINGVEIKYDEDEYNKSHESDTFTAEQAMLRERISDEFLKMCITEEFGVRGGIMNLVSTFDFIVELKIDELLEKMPYLDKPTGGELPYQNGRWLNINEEGEGTLNLNYVINEKNYLLALTQKRDVEEIKAVKKEAVAGYESVLNLVNDWPGGNKNWRPIVKLEAEEKDPDEEKEIQEENLFKKDYLSIEISQIVTKLKDKDDWGYILLFKETLELKGEEVDRLWLSKNVAQEIGINSEIKYQSNPKKFYLLKKFIIDRIKKERLDLVVNFRKQRIITQEEYSNLIT